jgi:hypothetical protein
MDQLAIYIWTHDPYTVSVLIVHKGEREREKSL